MQTIQVQRAAAVTDGYGDTVLGEFTTIASVDGYYAPSNSTEPIQIGRNAVVTGATIYVEAESRPDIQPQDRIIVEEGIFEIEGEIGFWSDEYGPAGYQFAVKTIKD